MKKIFLGIIGLLLFLPYSAKAYDRKYSNNLMDKCVNDGSCILLCGYEHQSRITYEFVEATYEYYSIYIYYHYSGKWQISWYSQEQDLKLATHTKIWDSIAEHKDDVFFQNGVNADLTTNGVCPKNGYVDISGASSEACFDNNADYCINTDPGGWGTDFKRQGSISTLKYNYTDHITIYFEQHAFPNLMEMTCDEVMSNQNAEDAVNEQVKDFSNFLFSNEMPAFMINNPIFQSKKDEAKNKYLGRIDICNEQKQNELDDKLKNQEITSEEHEKETKKLNETVQQTKDVIETIDEKITNSVASTVSYLDGKYANLQFTEGCDMISSDMKEWLIQFLDIIKISALILTIVLGMLDFVKAILSGEADAIKKAWKHFSKRLIAVTLLFLLPVIIEFILGIVSINGVNVNSPLCGIK